MWERLLHRLWIKPKKSTQSSSGRLRKVTKLSFEAFLIVTTLEKRLLENKLINTFYPFDARCVSLAAVSCSCIAGDNISLLYLKNQSSLCCLHFSFHSVSREFITLRISFERFNDSLHWNHFLERYIKINNSISLFLDLLPHKPTHDAYNFFTYRT